MTALTYFPLLIHQRPSNEQDPVTTWQNPVTTWQDAEGPRAAQNKLCAKKPRLSDIFLPPPFPSSSFKGTFHLLQLHSSAEPAPGTGQNAESFVGDLEKANLEIDFQRESRLFTHHLRKRLASQCGY